MPIQPGARARVVQTRAISSPQGEDTGATARRGAFSTRARSSPKRTVSRSRPSEYSSNVAECFPVEVIARSKWCAGCSGPELHLLAIMMLLIRVGGWVF